MDRNIEHISILHERALSLEAKLWINRIQEVAQRTGVKGFLKGGLLRDYINNLYNGTSLTPKDLDIMLLGGVNLIVSQLVKEGATIKLRRNRKKTPVFELILPTSQGIIDTDIGIVLGKPNSYEKVQKTETLIQDDARLSDFTVNTLFLPLGKPLDAINIIDPLGGIKDIQDKQIRMVSPNTFIRNPECMLRAIKMADRLSAVIEPITYEAIKHYAPLIKGVPRLVIDQNLETILKSPNREQNIWILENLGLLEQLNTTF